MRVQSRWLSYPEHGKRASQRRTAEMKRVGFLLKVKQDKIDEYKKQHEAVWPEMLEALERNGWHNYSLFMRDDGLLFGYFETPDSFQAALDGMAGEEINDKWQEFMAPYFEDMGGAHADESMVELEEVFHLD
jgi:L-rhamnose mutarotase